MIVKTFHLVDCRKHLIVGSLNFQCPCVITLLNNHKENRRKMQNLECDYMKRNKENT